MGDISLRLFQEGEGRSWQAQDKIRTLTEDQYQAIMKAKTVLTDSLGLAISLLVVRLFLGIRIFAGALKRFTDTSLLSDFEHRLAEKNIDPVIAGVVFGMLMICSVSLVTNWKIKWFCWGFAGVGIFIMASFSAHEYFEKHMPPLVSMMIAFLFAFIPVKKLVPDTGPEQQQTD